MVKRKSSLLPPDVSGTKAKKGLSILMSPHSAFSHSLGGDCSKDCSLWCGFFKLTSWDFTVDLNYTPKCAGLVWGVKNVRQRIKAHNLFTINYTPFCLFEEYFRSTLIPFRYIFDHRFPKLRIFSILEYSWRSSVCASKIKAFIQVQDFGSFGEPSCRSAAELTGPKGQWLPSGVGRSSAGKR